MLPTNYKQPLDQELCKQYLAGNLSAREMYAVEDRMLENDFFFEAIEGLERLPWDHCQNAVDNTKQQIREHFKVKPLTTWTKGRTIMATITILVMGVGLYWFIQSTPKETLDLSPNTKELLPPASNGATDDAETPIITTDSVKTDEDSLESRSTSQPLNVIPSSNQSTLTDKPKLDLDSRSTLLELASHITVGRIVDDKGVALTGVTVSTGGVTDNTDKSGYYALKVVPGITYIRINYAGVIKDVQIDTNQNWEIVLDLKARIVKEAYPIKGGNRFK